MTWKNNYLLDIDCRYKTCRWVPVPVCVLLPSSECVELFLKLTVATGNTSNKPGASNLHTENFKLVFCRCPVVKTTVIGLQKYKRAGAFGPHYTCIIIGAARPFSSTDRVLLRSDLEFWLCETRIKVSPVSSFSGDQLPPIISSMNLTGGHLLPIAPLNDSLIMKLLVRVRVVTSMHVDQELLSQDWTCSVAAHILIWWKTPVSLQQAAARLQF